MYDWTVFIHGWLRWLVVLSALGAVLMALRGWLGNRPWAPAQKGLGIAMIASMDLQILLGILAYLESPWLSQLTSDGGAVMKDAVARYWAVEHAFGMIVGAALIHVGYAKAKRAEEDAARHKAIAIWAGIGLLIVLATIPWPFRAAIARGWIPAFPG